MLFALFFTCKRSSLQARKIGDCSEYNAHFRRRRVRNERQTPLAGAFRWPSMIVCTASHCCIRLLPDSTQSTEFISANGIHVLQWNYLYPKRSHRRSCRWSLHGARLDAVWLTHWQHRGLHSVEHSTHCQMACQNNIDHKAAIFLIIKHFGFGVQSSESELRTRTLSGFCSCSL